MNDFINTLLLLTPFTVLAALVTMWRYKLPITQTATLWAASLLFLPFITALLTVFVRVLELELAFFASFLPPSVALAAMVPVGAVTGIAFVYGFDRVLRFIGDKFNEYRN